MASRLFGGRLYSEPLIWRAAYTGSYVRARIVVGWIVSGFRSQKMLTKDEGRHIAATWRSCRSCRGRSRAAAWRAAHGPNAGVFRRSLRQRAFSVVGLDAAGDVMRWKTSVAAPFLPVLLFLTSCFIPIPIVIPVPPDPARISAALEPPAQYDHPYNGQVVERVMPEAEARSVCMSMGTDLLTVACSSHSNGTCYIILPNDGQASVSTYRRHEIAHCNGWPANHPSG
jgi:hypothetical protein